MDFAWRFRLMFFAVAALMLFGDLFGYSSVRGVYSDTNQATSNKFQQKDTDLDIGDDSDITELSEVALKKQRNLAKIHLTDTIRDSCLPKMLCEMAAKPEYTLTKKEKELLHLIRSSTLSMSMNSSPSKWHFAAHMGELLRYTGDQTSGPIGCANLWPHCPISSKKLMKLSYKMRI